PVDRLRALRRLSFERRDPLLRTAQRPLELRDARLERAFVRLALGGELLLLLVELLDAADVGGVLRVLALLHRSSDLANATLLFRLRRLLCLGDASISILFHGAHRLLLLLRSG